MVISSDTEEAVQFDKTSFPLSCRGSVRGKTRLVQGMRTGHSDSLLDADRFGQLMAEAAFLCGPVVVEEKYKYSVYCTGLW